MTIRGDQAKAKKADVRCPTALELVECAESEDLSTSEGKKVLWGLLTHTGTARKMEFEALRTEYLRQGLKIGDANRQAALDTAASLPTSHELPAGLLDSLRMGDRAEGSGKGAPRPEYVVNANVEADAKVGRIAAEAGLAESRRAPKLKLTQLDRLYDRVEELGRGVRQPGLATCITWVATNIGRRLERIAPEDVPGLRALSMWIWAKKNESAFRQSFEAKQIPAKGLMDEDTKGYIDDGEPIDEILDRLATIEGAIASRSVSDVQV